MIPIRNNDLFTFTTPSSFSLPKHSGRLYIPLKKWEFLCHTLYLKKYPFLLGPKGCGKSSVARELAEAMGMDYYAFNMGQAFKPKKMFIGGLIIGDSGKTEAVRSEFFKAFISSRPTLIFLDELTRTPAVAANFLMTVLDRQQSYLYDEDSGKRYNKGEQVLFAAAGNTGFAYVSAQRLDTAFEDRFVKTRLDYLSPAEETALLMHEIKNISRSEASRLAEVARLLRLGEEKEVLSVSLSTRQVLDAAAYLPLGYTLQEIVEEVILTNYLISGEETIARSLLQTL
ncbi:AAA family ATPase [uncultured Odoribacter sp.]|uniref:AAA family ATPase n=1 Tax=uncultured Odoribacter sp. TaxID=876416 RepID=UPI00261E4B63|nr:AAA family ATPase [uncultured Odoribacter sp.]